jgi:hypothetical protein
MADRSRNEMIYDMRAMIQKHADQFPDPSDAVRHAHELTFSIEAAERRADRAEADRLIQEFLAIIKDNLPEADWSSFPTS